MRRIRDRRFTPKDDPGRWAEMLGRANVPARYARARISAIQVEPIRRWVEDVTEHPEKWLAIGGGFLLVGHLRSGKSSLAGILATDAMQRGEVVTWLASSEVPGVMFRDGQRQQELFDRLHETDLLILDDLGRESYRVDRPGGAALEGCVRAIYDRDRSIIVTSNLGDARLVANYPDTFISVLRRMTNLRVIENAQWPESPLS